MTIVKEDTVTTGEQTAQRMQALNRANAIRMQRASVRRWVGTPARQPDSWARAADVIVEARLGMHGTTVRNDLEHVRGMRVAVLLSGCRGISDRDRDTRTLRSIMAICGFTAHTTIAGLRGTQLRLLLVVLRAGGLEAARRVLDQGRAA